MDKNVMKSIGCVDMPAVDYNELLGTQLDKLTICENGNHKLLGFFLGNLDIIELDLRNGVEKSAALDRFLCRCKEQIDAGYL